MAGMLMERRYPRPFIPGRLKRRHIAEYRRHGVEGTYTYPFEGVDQSLGFRCYRKIPEEADASGSREQHAPPCFFFPSSLKNLIAHSRRYTEGQYK